jgi:hypothetical protein
MFTDKKEEISIDSPKKCYLRAMLPFRIEKVQDLRRETV